MATAHRETVAKHATLTATFADALGYASSAMYTYAAELEEAQAMGKKALAFADTAPAFPRSHTSMVGPQLTSVSFQRSAARAEAEAIGDLASLLADTATTKATATFRDVTALISLAVTEDLVQELTRLTAGASRLLSGRMAAASGPVWPAMAGGPTSLDRRRQSAVDQYIGKTPPATAAEKSKVLQLYMGAAVLPLQARMAYVETHVTSHPLANMYAGLMAPVVAATGDTLFAIGCATQPESCPGDIMGASALEASALAPRAVAEATGLPDFIPTDAAGKVPFEWGPGSATQKGGGWRWTDPLEQGNGVRIDPGNVDSSQPSQQGDHVVIRSGGHILGPDGEPITGPLSQNIPLSQWEQWHSWNQP